MNPDTLTNATVALSTLCTIIYVGLGFLPRPSRPSAIWSLAFFGFMAATYIAIAADTVDSLPLRALSSGLMLGMIGVIWVGLRLRRTRRQTAWIPTLAFLVVSTAVLIVSSTTPFYLTVVRITFAAAGVFAALLLVELIRVGLRLRDEILPLALISAAYLVLGVVALVYEGYRLLTGGSDAGLLDRTRDLNRLGSLVFVVCALVTLLLLTRQNTRRDDAAAATFRVVAADRLARAAEAGDRWWSVLVVRLDDPVALEEASSTNAFHTIAERFAGVVRASLPAEADIDRTADTEFVVLLPRPEGAVRQVLAQLLADVAAIGPDSPLSVRMSASVGWAPVEVIGYRLDELVAAATSAADSAAELGGDRWYRMTADDLVS